MSNRKKVLSVEDYMNEGFSRKQSSKINKKRLKKRKAFDDIW